MNEPETRVCVGAQGEREVLLPQHPYCWVKLCLWRLQNITSLNKNYETESPPLHRQRLLLVVCILLALLAMALLLFWNYQCFIVERMCEEESSAFPPFGALAGQLFGELVSTPTPDKGG